MVVVCGNPALTYLIMQDLNSKYQATKAQIQGNLKLLKDILSNQQFSEIKNFLDEKYVSHTCSHEQGKWPI